MQAYPNGGCYGQCYAFKIAHRYRIDFTKSVVRNEYNRINIERDIINHPLSWVRVGTMGDPSFNWDWTVEVCDWLGKFKIPVIVTKHWVAMSSNHIRVLRKYKAVINTSTSAS